MSGFSDRTLRNVFSVPRAREGKITLFTTLVISAAVLGFFSVFELQVPKAMADDIVTSVTVLNTAVVWTVDAQESTESSTTTPTNAGTVISWTGTGTDSNADNYYLLICKTSGAPTANSGAPPQCNGGISNQWAVSSVTASAAQATAATTTKATFPFENERNDWWAFICDDNASLARCNSAFRQGSGVTASPFVINHPPIFASVSNDGPKNPGQSVTWTTVAYDNDTIRGANDTVRLLACKVADFSGTSCGAGGTWATSTFATTNPSTSTPVIIPTQDRLYNAFVYLYDDYNLVATSTVHGSNSSFTVSNVAPTVTDSTIAVVDTDNVGNLTLTVPQATSGPFKVQFQVTDNNSCLNSSAGNEISSAITNVYRSGVGVGACQLSGDYNSNNCYSAASPLFVGLVCTQDAGQCSGATDPDVTWTCTFPLWYNADPTDASTPWTAQNWLASVRVTDDNATTSALTEALTGNDLTSFLAFNVSDTSIGFGSLEPGQQNDPLATTTDLIAIGNVGLDELLYGDTMCTTWTIEDSCDAGGINAATEIPVNNQKFATSSVAYASALAYTLTASTATSTLLINVPKTTVTSSPQTKDTYWGINIPVAITLAGNYTGQNTILAAVSNFLNW